jgi:hypothetical protein
MSSLLQDCEDSDRMNTELMADDRMDVALTEDLVFSFLQDGDRLVTEHTAHNLMDSPLTDGVAGSSFSLGDQSTNASAAPFEDEASDLDSSLVV